MSKLTELQNDPAFLEMRSYLQRIATGPEMSKDLSRQEAQQGMQLILDDKVDPVQAALFLIALRMKRETDEENLGTLQAMMDSNQSAVADVDHVLTLADPFNGYNRSLPVSPFLPAVLAACGLATVSSGLETVSPKFGISHRRVLAAAGANVDLSPAEAAARISDPACGWAYVDQAEFNPALNRLVDLRTLMVKRSLITTMEVMLPPVLGKQSSGIVTGYVHRPYPRVYAMLARQVGYAECLLVRGVEGGVVPSLRQQATMYQYHDQGEETPFETDPSTIGIQQDLRAVAIPEHCMSGESSLDVDAACEAAAKAGLAALDGTQGASRDGLIYAASICLLHHGLQDQLDTAAAVAREVLDGGAAKACFDAL